MWAGRGRRKQKTLARLKIALYIAGEQFGSRRDFCNPSANLWRLG